MKTLIVHIEVDLDGPSIHKVQEAIEEVLADSIATSNLGVRFFGSLEAAKHWEENGYLNMGECCDDHD